MCVIIQYSKNIDFLEAATKIVDTTTFGTLLATVTGWKTRKHQIS